jgi:hypothetical protein
LLIGEHRRWLRLMKKLGSVGLASVFLFLLSAVPAFAGSELPPPAAKVGGVIVQPPGAAPGTTAFTGSGLDVPLWMVVTVVLLAAGIAFLVAGRRRRASVSA